MANIASVAYAIEGPQKNLEEILGAICLAMTDKKHWTEYKACELLGFSHEAIDKAHLGGEISEEPSLDENTLEFYAEERWGLQDFEELLRQKFPDIKIYWIVEESGCEVYATNDKEGKYFPERYYVELCLDDQSEMEYFKTEKDMYNWLEDMTKGIVYDADTVDAFNGDYDDDENYILIHEFDVCD